VLCVVKPVIGVETAPNALRAVVAAAAVLVVAQRLLRIELQTTADSDLASSVCVQ
jgi:hypothetical protein